MRVQADVIDVQTGEGKNTNEFHFTWGVEGHEPLNKTVVPVTYTGLCLVRWDLELELIVVFRNRSHVLARSSARTRPRCPDAK